MKKQMVKKLAAIISVASMCLCGSRVFAEMPQKLDSSLEQDSSAIMPCYLAISTCKNDFSIKSSGKTTCIGSTMVQPGYVAGLKIELQQYNRGWKTIKNWSGSSENYVGMTKYQYVTSGYSYRLKLTHTAKTGSGSTVETVTKYSDTVYY